MNRKLIVAAVLFAIVAIGCAKPAQESAATENPEFRVDKLFTHEGCTAYRFHDSGRHIYYTVCNRGEVQTHYTENCGKNCTRSVDVPTSYYATVQEE